MHIKHTLLRVAAAATVTTVITLGTGAPSQAVMAAGEASDKGASQSAEGQAKADANQQAAAEKQAAGQGDQGGDQAPTTGPDHSQGNASTVGPVDEPQPESTADRNDGGANSYDCEADPGPYCSTRDGGASANGKGDGEATGRPAAGSVGKADNKNPRGQEPGPSDRNNGYECDGNQGIAKGNPAHTACTESPAEAPVVAPVEEEAPVEDVPAACPDAASMDGDACVTPADVVVDEVAGVQAALPVSTEVPATVQLQAAPALNRAPAQIAPAAGVLPSTGAGDYLLPLTTGALFLVAGAALLARRRLHG